MERSASRNYFVGTEAVISISGSGAEIFFCNYFSPFISNRMVANLNWAESSIKLKFAILYERDNSVLELEKKQKWIKLYRPHFLMVSVLLRNGDFWKKLFQICGFPYYGTVLIFKSSSNLIDGFKENCRYKALLQSYRAGLFWRLLLRAGLWIRIIF